MIAFFISATLLLLVAVALLVYPLARGRAVDAGDLRDEVVALSRERLEELRQKRDAGEIGDAEYDAQVRDLETQLADDLYSGETGSGPKPGRGGGWVGVAVLVFVPVLSGLLYLTLGQPQTLFLDERTPTTQTGSATDGDHPDQLESMVTQLAERLEANPDDPEGWFMLGRSYMALQRYEDAAQAFGRLRALVGDEPDVLVREATALALTRGGSLGGEPIRLVRTALDRQPDHPQALWLAATAAYQAADYETALGYYQRVRPMVQGEQRAQIDDMLRDLADRGYGDAQSLAGDDDSDAAAGSTAAGASLTVNVTVAPALRERLEGDETVFVFARAVDGPPMPLAVVRRAVADLPLTVTLDDSQAMTPQLRLSAFERVTVSARISSSGEPAARPGDLQGQSAPLATETAETVDITIDRVLTATD